MTAHDQRRKEPMGLTPAHERPDDPFPEGYDARGDRYDGRYHGWIVRFYNGGTGALLAAHGDNEDNPRKDTHDPRPRPTRRPVPRLPLPAGRGMNYLVLALATPGALTADELLDTFPVDDYGQPERRIWSANEQAGVYVLVTPDADLVSADAGLLARYGSVTTFTENQAATAQFEGLVRIRNHQENCA